MVKHKTTVREGETVEWVKDPKNYSGGFTVVGGTQVQDSEELKYSEERDPNVGASGACTPVQDFLSAIETQVAEIKAKHPSSGRFCIIDETDYESTPLRIGFLRQMTTHERNLYAGVKAKTAEQRKAAQEKREKREREQLAKLQAKYGVNTQATTTERTPSTEKATSNTPKAGK